MSELEARREIMRWVARRLLTLADLPPHDWDRSSLRSLAESLSEENPRLEVAKKEEA